MTPKKNPPSVARRAGVKEKTERVDIDVTIASHANTSRRIRELDKVEALNIIDRVARNFAFWRRHGEHFSACRAIRNHLRLAVAAIDLPRRS